jgi:hypothetical protein
MKRNNSLLVATCVFFALAAIGTVTLAAMIVSWV